MTKKDLTTYLRAKRDYQVASMHLTEFETTMFSIPGGNYTGMPRGGGLTDKLSGMMDRHKELVAKKEEARQALLEAERNLSHIISSLPLQEGEFVFYTYMCGYDMEDVLVLLDIKKTAFFELKKVVLKKIEKM